MEKIITIMLVVSVVTFAQQKGTFTDSRDGKKYKTVKIGEQTWMAENLNYAAKDSKCYDNKPANCQKYGRLYNWDDAMKSCPSGWHLPGDKEWDELIEFAGGKNVAGKNLKAKDGLHVHKFDDRGRPIKPQYYDDKFGFAAVLVMGSDFCYDETDFCNYEIYVKWWSRNDHNFWFIYSDGIYQKAEGYYYSHNASVRCVKD